jgi:integrase
MHIRPELGKSKQERRGRMVPIAPVLVAELAGWGLRVGPLVGDLGGDVARVAKAVRRAWKRAGVPPIVWARRPDHAFRKGFVSGLQRAGADRDAVEYLVGHSRGLRGVYVDPDALPLIEAVALVPPMRPCVQGAYKVRPRLAKVGV